MKKGLFLLISFFAGSLFAHEQSTEALYQVIENYVRSELENSHPGGDFNIIVSPINTRLHLPACDAPNPSVAFGHFNQPHVTIQVACIQPRWDIRVPVKIQHFSPIAIAAFPIQKNQIISAHDVRLVRKEINTLSEGYFESIQDLIGLTASNTIPSGSIIKRHVVKTPTLIKRGDSVKIIIQSPGLNIEARGVAQAEGKRGETVRVKNSHSNKIIDAVVTDHGVTTVM